MCLGAAALSLDEDEPADVPAPDKALHLLKARWNDGVGKGAFRLHRLRFAPASEEPCKNVKFALRTHRGERSPTCGGRGGGCGCNAPPFELDLDCLAATFIPHPAGHV